MRISGAGKAFSTPEARRSFCDDLSHRQAAHLQGATHRQADHGEGADQHADCYHSAFEVAHTWELGNA